MIQSHFEAFRPTCPVCRKAGRGAQLPDRSPDQPLALTRVLREGADGDVIEGLLQCRRAECLREYPVIDGVPLLIAEIRAYLASALPRVTAREDLSPTIESLLGDCAGPGSEYDNTRRELSTYGWDHYGDLGEEEGGGAGGAARPGSAVRLLEAMLELAGSALDALPDGPVLDTGCSVGRTTFELARALGSRGGGARPTLGLDLNFAMLRAARRVLTEGVACYPLRRVGMVYDRLEHPAELSARGASDFWAADAAALPFADGSIALAASLNVIDCVQSPRDALAELARVLAPGGLALVTTPYDWSPGATPYEQWLGGHSQRGETRGAAEPVLRALLTPGAHQAAVEGVEIVADAEDLPWYLRLHDRSTVEYRVHGLVLRKR